MGLFDNLFLDQNTPVMINDGVDHSKDVVTEIIPPSSGGGASGGTGDDGSSSTDPEDSKTKKEEGFEELFEEEKIKEIIDIPAPAIEFKLSPETLGDSNPAISVASEKLDDSDVSFDIGGDMNFDIGGDIGESSGILDSINTSESFIESNVSVNSLGSSISGNTSPTIQSEADPIASVEVVNTEIISETPQEVTPTLMESQNVGNNSETDSALFSLLNDNSSDSNPAISEMISTVPSPEGSSSTDNAIILSGDKKEEDGGIFDASVISHLTPDFIDTPIHSDIISPTASKLKSKLEEFIDELKTLEIEDQEVKNKKRQQFEMFRVRAQEIKAEYDMRIHALELEEKALENQIAAMDNEKTQIKDVIRAFKKELEKA